MSAESEHINDDLLVKYINAETSEQENRAVELWLDASKENQRYFEELQKVWNLTGTGSELSVNLDEAWGKVNARIESYESVEPVIRNLPNRNRWYWAAASVVLLLGVWGVFRWSQPQEQVLLSSTQTIEQELSDGSLVTLNANSELSFPEEFKGNSRQVQLKGEAYFEIERKPEKPFLVQTKEGIIKVLGTAFNVKAHQDENLKVHVSEGVVQLSLPNAKHDSLRVILNAGETGIIEYKSKNIYKELPIAEDAMFWFNRKLSFNKTPLPRVFEVLSRNYEVDFKAANQPIDRCLLSARFENENIESILEVISATFNIHFEVNANQIKIESHEVDCKQ